MAPSAPTVIEIFPWPVFQALEDSLACIGGKLYSFQPESSTPKATFADPFFITPNPNPTILDDQGKAIIYLQDFYDLRLFNAEDVLVWEVSRYTFDSGVTPAIGEVVTGSTEVSVDAVAGGAALIVTGLVPLGYRLLGVHTHIQTGFGTSAGLTGLLIGDSTYCDGWGRQTNLTAGATTTQVNFRRGDMPIAGPSAYQLLIAPEGGAFDSTGRIHAHAYWQALSAEPHA